MLSGRSTRRGNQLRVRVAPFLLARSPRVPEFAASARGAVNRDLGWFVLFGVVRDGERAPPYAVGGRGRAFVTPEHLFSFQTCHASRKSASGADCVPDSCCALVAR